MCKKHLWFWLSFSLVLITSAAAVAAPFAYVAVRDAGYIAVIDTGTNSVVAKLPVRLPEEVFAEPGGRRLFVPSAFGYDTVSVIGTGTNGVLASASVLGLAQTRRSVAFSPDGCLSYVLASDRDNVTVLDARGGVVRSQIVTGRRPWALSIGADGSRLYVVNRGSNSVSVIDTATGTAVAAIAVGSNPVDIAIHPDGRTGYVANRDDGTVSVIDLVSNRVVAVPPAPLGVDASISISPDGTRVYAGATSSSILYTGVISVISTSTNSVIGTVSADFSYSGKTAVAFSPDSKRAYVTGSAGVVAVDVASSSVVGVVSIGGAQRIALTPDGGRAYVTFQGLSTSGVAVVDTNTLTELTRIKLDSDPVGITVVDPPPAAAGFIGLVEPALGINLSPGFYIAEVRNAPSSAAGYWGMSVLTLKGQLIGGFNLGGGVQESGATAAFGAFYISEPQVVKVDLNAQPLKSGGTEQMAIGLRLLDSARQQVIPDSSGTSSISFSQLLSSGFYIVEIRTGSSAPRSNFQLGLNAPFFSGGINVGGFVSPGQVGFGAFYVPEPQQVKIAVLGRPSYGSAGASCMQLTLLDASRKVITTVP
jgi:YVTN family beta-propeller protein